MYTMTVAPGADASGSFYSLKAAFAAMPEDPTVPVTIRVMPGIYHEKLSLMRPNVTIEGAGASPSDTVISFGDYGYEIMPDGIKRGTFRSYTFFVHAADVTLRNLTIENTAGDSKTHGQAIALYAECDRFIAESCRILGHQDTLFTGPLPPRNTSPAAFAGRPSPRRASTADNIIITAISAAISTLFSAVRPLTLKAVRSHP